MLSLRIIAEMGANFLQRYYSAEAFAKGIGVVPANEVSGGKLLKRHASHGNSRLKFHLLSGTKGYAIHGSGPLRTWYDSYRGRTNFMKTTPALARRIAEALWWVMLHNESYRYWQGKRPREGCEVVQLGRHLISTETGELLDTLATDRMDDE